MKCYDKQGNLIAGEILLASKLFPNKAIFRDEESSLYLAEITGDIAKLNSEPISRKKAFDVAEKCIAGVSIQGSTNGAMNAMAVTMLAAICEYEQIIEGLENKSIET